MGSFHDVSFPLNLAFGASGGPVRKAHITPLASGGERRNSPHAHSRRHYNAAAGLKSNADLQKLIAFFEARHGQLYSFRFKDPVDYLSCESEQTPAPTDQFIGYGDGETLRFQLYKNYGDAAGHYRRKITKPVSVSLALDGAAMDPADFSLDARTGVVTFTAAPEMDSIITAGFAFDVAVRFASDRLDVSLEAFGAGEVTQVPLVEVFDA